MSQQARLSQLQKSLEEGLSILQRKKSEMSIGGYLPAERREVVRSTERFHSESWAAVQRATELNGAATEVSMDELADRVEGLCATIRNL